MQGKQGTLRVVEDGMGPCFHLLTTFIFDRLWAVFQSGRAGERPGWDQKSLARKHMTDRFCRR